MAESAQFEVVANISGAQAIDDLVESLERLNDATTAAQQAQSQAATATEYWYGVLGDVAPALDEIIQKTTGLDLGEFMRRAVEAGPELVAILENAGITLEDFIRTFSELDFTTDDWRESLGELAGPIDEVVQKITGLNLEQLAENVQNADGQTRSWGDALNEMLGPLDDVVRRVTGFSLASLSAAGAVAGVILTFVSWTKEIINLGDELVDLAKRRDVSVGFLEEMKFIGEQTGVSFQLLTMASQELSRRIASDTPAAAKAIEALGLSMSELLEMNSEDRFRTVSAALADIENPAKRAQVAFALFGRTGRELANLGPEVEELTALYKELGLEIDPGLLGAGENLADNWKVLMAIFEKARSEELDPIVRALSLMSDEMIEQAKQAKQNEEQTNQWAEAFKYLNAAMLPVYKLWLDIRSLAEWYAGPAPKAGTPFKDVGTPPTIGSQGDIDRELAAMTGVREATQLTTVAVTELTDAMKEQATQAIENAKREAELEAGAKALGTNLEDLREQYGASADVRARFAFEQMEAEKAGAKAAKEGIEAASKAQEEWNRQLKEAIPLARELFKYQPSGGLPTTEIEGLTGGNFRFPGISGSTPGVQQYESPYRNAADDAIALSGIIDTLSEQTKKYDREQEELKEQYERTAEATEEWYAALDIAYMTVEALGPLADTVFGSVIVNMMNARAAGEGLNAAFEQMKLTLKDAESGFDDLLTSALGMFGAVMQGISAIDAATEGGGIQGILGGVSAGAQFGQGLAGPWGAAVGAVIGGIIGAIRSGGRDADTVAAEAGRDLGVTLTDEMAQAIHESGKNVQLFIGQLFEAGLYKDNLDKFAEEVGDVLSGLEQGLYTAEEAQTALAESVPYLIENYDELGEAGQANVERIIEAADRLGVTFEGLDELRAKTFSDEEILEVVDALGVTEAAAKALGITLGLLREEVESIFAPATLEEMAEEFDKTAEEMRAILESLGIKFQTDIERMAASLGLTVEDFQALGAAFEAATGLPAEQLTQFLEQSGISVADLAKQLGVDITASLGSVNEEIGTTNEELLKSVAYSGQMADNLYRAAVNASNIHVDIPGAQPAAGGMDEMVYRPKLILVGEAGPEHVKVTPVGTGKASGGAGATFEAGSIVVNLPPGTPEEHAKIMVEVFQKNIGGATTQAQFALGISR